MPLYISIPLIFLITLVLSYIISVMWVCFYRIFYAPDKKKQIALNSVAPEGKIYDPFRNQMREWQNSIQEMEHTDVSVVSFDGLTLRGRYFEHKKDAPIEILFHGYRGSSQRDLCGGVHRCLVLGRNALIVDQRSSGTSDGHIITFGAKESRDCQTWANYVVENIDKDAKIILTGISMGAATVMNAASMELPKNVIGILADCGYTSTEEIIKKVMRDMKLPANIVYPFARLSAILFCGFDPSGTAPIKSMKNCKLPIIFFHGDTDAFVPCYMSEQNYAACASEHKRLVITPGAGHGLCFPIDSQTYLNELDEFFRPHI